MHSSEKNAQNMVYKYWPIYLVIMQQICFMKMLCVYDI